MDSNPRMVVGRRPIQTPSAKQEKLDVAYTKMSRKYARVAREVEGEGVDFFRFESEKERRTLCDINERKTRKDTVCCCCCKIE